MSEKHPGAVRRRSRAEVDRLVGEYEASGKTRQEFCAEHGVSLSSLARYRNRRGRRAEECPRRSRFLRVEVSRAAADGGSEPGGGLAVALGSGRRIEVRRGFDAGLLVELVQVLEQV